MAAIAQLARACGLEQRIVGWQLRWYATPHRSITFGETYPLSHNMQAEVLKMASRYPGGSWHIVAVERPGAPPISDYYTQDEGD